MDLVQYIAPTLSGLLVFILGKLISGIEFKRSGDSSVTIKQIDDRAKLTEELWNEVRLNRVEINKLIDELIEEKKKDIYLETVNQLYLEKIKELEKKIELLTTDLGKKNEQNENS